VPSPQAVKESLKYLAFSFLTPVGKLLVSPSVPILTYHSLDESHSPISVTPSAFGKQMLYLKAQGFRTITLSDFLHRLRSGHPFPENSFVLTFDDGFKNVYEKAFPILSELGFTATVFLVTDLMNQTISWEITERIRNCGVHRFQLLSWRQVEEMHRHGFSFGSHSSRHRPLTRLNSNSNRKDIERSKRSIEDKLGVPCRLFCYPYGQVNESLKLTVQQAGFEGAVTTKFGRNKAGADPYTLRRIGSAHFTNSAVFKAAIYGTYGWNLPQGAKH
jgi:peptidoglycan/xylan/chitin deacetylase (PgdA/CDA1 family)